MKNRNSNILIVLGLLIAISSLFYIQKVDKRMTAKKSEIERSKNDFIEQMKLDKEKSEFSDELVNIFNRDENDKHDNNLFEREFGYIEIESLDLILPIYSDTTYKSLKEGIGIVEGTDMPSANKNNTSVLAGHRGGYNGKESFLNVNKLKKGDLIKVVEDKELIYEVIEQEVIESTDWTKFTKEEDESKLILLTCHPYPINDKRLIIKTKLIDIKSI